MGGWKIVYCELYVKLDASNSCNHSKSVNLNQTLESDIAFFRPVL